MTENNKENNNQSMDSSEQKDAIMNLANNLAKNENTIDMSSIMRMATNLLQNDSLMNSVKDIGKYKQNPTINVPKIQDKTELTLINEQLEKITNHILEIKNEITNQNEQNKKLIENLMEQILILEKDKRENT